MVPCEVSERVPGGEICPWHARCRRLSWREENRSPLPQEELPTKAREEEEEVPPSSHRRRTLWTGEREKGRELLFSFESLGICCVYGVLSFVVKRRHQVLWSQHLICCCCIILPLSIVISPFTQIIAFVRCRYVIPVGLAYIYLNVTEMKFRANIIIFIMFKIICT